MTATAGPDEVVVVVGSGAMGLASARRLASGRHLVLADFDPRRLEPAVSALHADGHAVEAVRVDVRDQQSVRALAATAAARGSVRALVHTAGVSPTQASTRDILHIDLVGAALVLDAFLAVAGPTTSVVCISSMAGHRARLDAELERRLANAPPAQLLALDGIDYESADRSGAYDIAKRGVHLRVAAAAIAYGRRGARVNSLSPGIVATPMSHEELGKDHGDFMRAVIAAQPVLRIGSPEDIAAAVEFLCSPASAFVTGTDLLVDGGATATMTWGDAPLG